ncbi:MAG: hypothetical protein HXX16_17305 [Bacteroidales bacterium]|nr:hypothetical protein [Bacteroidales bacterium]
MCYLVNYNASVITSNESIEADGFSKIYFENIGTDSAFIDAVIPLTHPKFFDNDPENIINDKFKVSFAGANADKRVLVIKTYFEKKP